jgi:hypothetical protein
MARTWLDVYTAEHWRAGLKKYKRAAPVVPTNPKPPIKGAGALIHVTKGAVTATAEKGETILEEIAQLLTTYHTWPKDHAIFLPCRIQMLERISERCGAYLALVNNPEAAKASGDAKKGTGLIDPWVRALAKKARNKAAYIKMLSNYLYSAKEKYINPELLIDFVTQTPRRVFGDLYGLVPGVRMEKVDFLHRNFEFRLKGDGTFETHNGLDMAFAEWVAEVERGGTPFFLWLEKHPVCTQVNADKYNTVAKDHATQYGAGKTTIQVVTPKAASLVAVSLGEIGNDPPPQAKPFDTFDYGKHSKLPFGAAYVWAKNGEIYCGPHGVLHHSSLQSGKKVKCAGMIRVKNGKVEYVNNDSGHYKPPLEALRSFVLFLNQNAVFAQGAEVCNHAIRAGTAPVPVWLGKFIHAH